ncbi:RING-H2 finger protein ATL5F, putative [Ricinus communis]|uniref:RING-H2 finger protein ATL5F, putative n=1 Tax=Ricinus communis TaxID=3988 RepID=B9T3N0_RICCO|nr:RING-H2 finger protein ATL5F, putative [Ricinus communis]|eukprot:XP_002532849.1 E3 ubiquitin-protein ligase RING1 [Ricinus communis]
MSLYQPPPPLPLPPPPPPPPHSLSLYSNDFMQQLLGVLIGALILMQIAAIYICIKSAARFFYQTQNHNDTEQGRPRNRPPQPQPGNQPPRPQPLPPERMARAKVIVIAGRVFEYKSEVQKPNVFCRECVICLEEFKDGEECRIFTKCNHFYHNGCIDKWLIKHRHCPICRESVRPRANDHIPV